MKRQCKRARKRKAANEVSPGRALRPLRTRLVRPLGQECYWRDVVSASNKRLTLPSTSTAFTSDDAGSRIESESLAFEAGKPYLISQWRWPGRFRPVNRETLRERPMMWDEINGILCHAVLRTAEGDADFCSVFPRRTS